MIVFGIGFHREVKHCTTFHQHTASQ
jgi:hypothetical protein